MKFTLEKTGKVGPSLSLIHIFPAGKYNLNEVDLLILIPAGYRDTRLDMFYVFPEVILKDEQKKARKTEVNHTFQSRTRCV